jgi:hypothetical protein
MHGQRVRRTGRVESGFKKCVPDTFFEAALHVPVLEEGQVSRHGTENPGTENPGTVLRLYVLCRFPAWFVIDTYLAPPALALRCNCVLHFRGCRRTQFREELGSGQEK